MLWLQKQKKTGNIDELISISLFKIKHIHKPELAQMIYFEEGTIIKTCGISMIDFDQSFTIPQLLLSNEIVRHHCYRLLSNIHAGALLSYQDTQLVELIAHLPFMTHC